MTVAGRMTGGGSLVRAFAAFEIPGSVRRLLREGIEALRRELPGARWVRPDGVHVTVKFLGDSAPALVDELAERLAPKLTGADPVTVRFRGAGFFPSPRRPRVAWVGGEAPGAEEVVRRVEETAVRLGWERESRPWSLHLTVARLRDPWPPAAVERFLAWGETFSPPPFECGDLVLFRSRLQPGGAVYTPLHRLALSLVGE